MQTCCLTAVIINANVSAAEESKKAKDAVTGLLFMDLVLFALYLKFCGTGQILDAFKIIHSCIHESKKSIRLICIFSPS